MAVKRAGVAAALVTGVLLTGSGSAGAAEAPTGVEQWSQKLANTESDTVVLEPNWPGRINSVESMEAV